MPSDLLWHFDAAPRDQVDSYQCRDMVLACHRQASDGICHTTGCRRDTALDDSGMELALVGVFNSSGRTALHA